MQTRTRLLAASLFSLTLGAITLAPALSRAAHHEGAQAASAQQAPNNVAPEGWTALFNGKDIDGWVLKSGKATYQVKDGIITGTTAEGSPNSFLTTPNEYSDFELTFDVMLHNDELNSGCQIRSKVVQDDSYGGRIGGPQCEIEKSPGQSGLIYGEFTEKKWMSPDATKRTNKAVKSGEWNSFHIIAKGNNIKTFINGEKIEDLDLPQEYYERFTKGVIGLQVHAVKGDPKWSVSWRNIYIKELGE